VPTTTEADVTAGGSGDVDAVAPMTLLTRRLRGGGADRRAMATSCDSVAGTAPAGSAGDVWRCRRARVRRRAVGQPPRRRANERRRGMMSPMTSVAARGVEVGAVPAGSAGDELPSRRVRARRRKRATIIDRRRSRRRAAPADSRMNGGVQHAAEAAPARPGDEQ